LYTHTKTEAHLLYKHICVGTSYTTITIEVQNICTVDYSLHFITEIHSRYPCTNHHGGTKSNEKWMINDNICPCSICAYFQPAPTLPMHVLTRFSSADVTSELAHWQSHVI